MIVLILYNYNNNNKQLFVEYLELQSLIDLCTKLLNIETLVSILFYTHP